MKIPRTIFRIPIPVWFAGIALASSGVINVVSRNQVSNESVTGYRWEPSTAARVDLGQYLGNLPARQSQRCDLVRERVEWFDLARTREAHTTKRRTDGRCKS
jgi:hypothetical protein